MLFLKQFQFCLILFNARSHFLRHCFCIDWKSFLEFFLVYMNVLDYILKRRSITQLDLSQEIDASTKQRFMK